MAISNEEFCRQLDNKDWTPLYLTEDPDIAYSILEENICEILDRESPIIKIQPSRQNKAWISKESIDKFKVRDKLRDIAARTKDPNDRNNYKSQRNICSKLAKDDKIKYFSKKYEDCNQEGDINKLYTITKKQLDWKTGGSPQSFLMDGKIVSSSKVLAELQTKYFFQI